MKYVSGVGPGWVLSVHVVQMNTFTTIEIFFGVQLVFSFGFGQSVVQRMSLYLAFRFRSLEYCTPYFCHCPVTAWEWGSDQAVFRNNKVAYAI